MLRYLLLLLVTAAALIAGPLVAGNKGYVLIAIGQTLLASDLADGGLSFESGRIAVDAACRTSLPGVWAGGDCVAGGSDLTVAAVADGKAAAASIIAALQGAAVPHHAGA